MIRLVQQNDTSYIYIKTRWLVDNMYHACFVVGYIHFFLCRKVDREGSKYRGNIADLQT